MELGINRTHFSTGDENKPQCPQCYSNTYTTLRGTITVKSSSQPVYECTSCSRLFSSEERSGGIKGILDEARDVEHDKNAHYTPISSISVESNGDTENLSNMENKLDNVDHSIMSLSSYLSSIQISIDNLANSVREVMEKNMELTEKIAKDPLVNVRKAVNDFNLE